MFINIMQKVIILGSGCAGLTAAIYTARANLSPLIIEGNQPGGQLTTTSEVENFPGFPQGINGFTMMENLRKQAKRFGANFIHDTIKSVNFSNEKNKIIKGISKTYKTCGLIIATGASPKFLGISGEKQALGGKGVATCATCDGPFYKNMEVIVVGGGDSACEEALFLTHFCNKVTLIHRRDQLKASAIMTKRVLGNKKITIIWNTTVNEVLLDGSGLVYGVLVKNNENKIIDTVFCKGVFIAIGHTPNTSFLKEVLKLDKLGYIIPELGSMVRTLIPGIYCAGDCSDNIYRQAITAAGMGCQAAIEVERWLMNINN